MCQVIFDTVLITIKLYTSHYTGYVVARNLAGKEIHRDRIEPLIILWYDVVMHAALKIKAINLRKQGYSYNLISEKIHISKSTLSDWLSTIPYKPNKEVVERIGSARAASGEAKHRLKLQSLEEAKKQAISDLGTINKRDLFMLGLGLYIGEGGKTQDILRIINADPRIMKLSVRWFKEVCGLSIKNFRIIIHLYPDNDRDECLNFWSKTTGIPLGQFGKTQIDRRQNKKLFKRGKLRYGTAHLTILSNGRREYGVSLMRRVLAWVDRVLTE